MFCPNCGTETSGDYCPQCGTSVGNNIGQQTKEAVANKRKKILFPLFIIAGVAVVLCILLIVKPFHKNPIIGNWVLNGITINDHTYVGNQLNVLMGGGEATFSADKDGTFVLVIGINRLGSGLQGEDHPFEGEWNEVDDSGFSLGPTYSLGLTGYVAALDLESDTLVIFHMNSTEIKMYFERTD